MAFLKFLGIFVLAIIFVVFAAYFWIRWKIRGFVAQLGETLGAMAAMAQLVPPLRITLTRADDLQWDDPVEVGEQAQPLLSEGFQTAGFFDVEEAPLKLYGLADPARSIWGVIYEHDQLGVWLDLVTRYADGSAFTASNTTATMGLQRPPNKALEVIPGASSSEVLERFLDARPEGELLPTPPAGFAARFQQSYAEEMDWHVQRGGPTLEEVRGIAMQDGVEVEEGHMEQVKAMWQAQVNDHLEEQLRETYLASTGASAAEWEGMRDRLVFVHDRLGAEEVADRYRMALDWDDEETSERLAEEAGRVVASARPREAFAQLNAALSRERAFEKVGQVDAPCVADVYLLSAAVED